MRAWTTLVVATVLIGGAAAGPVRAAAAAAAETEVRLLAGVAFSDLDTRNLGSTARAGFAGGLGVDFGLLSLRGGVEGLYAQKGFMDAPAPAGGTTEYRAAVLQIPLLVRFAFPRPRVKPALCFGPQIGFPVDSELRGPDGAWTDVKSATPAAVWSLVAGAQVRFLGLGAELRYEHGLTDLLDPAAPEIVLGEGDATKDRTWTLLFSYRIR